MNKIILYTPSLYPGGVLESNRLLANGFKERGYDIIILANRETDYKIENHKHIYLKSGDLGRIFKIKKIIEKEQPLAIFANMLPQNISLSMAKFLQKTNSKTKYFGFVRNSTSFLNYNRYIYYPYRLFIKKLYENLDNIIAVSNIVKEDIKKAFFIDEKKIKVIFDPLNIDEIREKSLNSLNEEEDEIFKNKTLLFVGRLSIQKRVDLLIDIFKEISEEVSDLNLVIIGEGEEKEKLKDKVKKYMLENRIFFLPFTKNPYKYMRRATLFTLTSQDEGFGRVVAESLACETPVIAFYNDSSGHRDIILNGHNGYLIPFGDIKGFKEKIIEILRNNSVYNTLKSNCKTNLANFDIKNIIDSLEKLINNND